MNPLTFQQNTGSIMPSQMRSMIKRIGKFRLRASGLCFPVKCCLYLLW